MGELEQHFVDVGEGNKIHVVAQGNPENPVILLVHGFPTYSVQWADYLKPLAEAGFRALALDLRGAGESFKPQEVADYHVDEISKDLIAVANWTGKEKINLFGHDWGGLIVWNFAEKHPERVIKFGSANGPHIMAFLKSVMEVPAQMTASWYIYFFQMKNVATWLLEKDDFALNKMTLLELKEIWSEEVWERYCEVVRNDGLRFINLYRNMPGYLEEYTRDPSLSSVKITPPALLIQGNADMYICNESVEFTKALCETPPTMKILEGEQHWYPVTKPGLVIPELINFFS
jgi:pimeloyl-ACP methyl ester carboxylesterase